MRFEIFRKASVALALLLLAAGAALPVHAQSAPFSLPSWHQLLSWLSPLWPGGLDAAGASADPYGGALPPGDAGASSDPHGLQAPGDAGASADPHGQTLRSVMGREGASADPHGVPVAPETKIAPGDEGWGIDPHG